MCTPSNTPLRTQYHRALSAKRATIGILQEVPCIHPPHSHTATHCNAHSNILQHTHGSTHCNTATHTWRNILQHNHAPRPSSPQHTATHCNTLQHTATHCNTLPYASPRIAAAKLPGVCSIFTATRCNTLQHCNTLHHAATHCNTYMQHARHAGRYLGCSWKRA